MYLNIIYINGGIKGQDSYILQLKRQIILFIEITRELFFLPILGEKRIDRINNSHLSRIRTVTASVIPIQMMFGNFKYLVILMA